LSIQFSRSIRSLNIDSFKASRVGLIFGSVLMLALVFWFFFARVSVYETSQELSIDEQGYILAEFPDDSMTKIQAGQDVLVRVFSSSDQPPISIQGVVFDTFPDSNQVEIIMLSDDLLDVQITENMQAQVDVEIELVTPFNLVMRYSGKFVETNQSLEDSQIEALPNNQ
jgi:multidrug resistance efflux pump